MGLVNSNVRTSTSVLSTLAARHASCCFDGGVMHPQYILIVGIDAFADDESSSSLPPFAPATVSDTVNPDTADAVNEWLRCGQREQMGGPSPLFVSPDFALQHSCRMIYSWTLCLLCVSLLQSFKGQQLRRRFPQFSTGYGLRMLLATELKVTITQFLRFS